MSSSRLSVESDHPRRGPTVPVGPAAACIPGQYEDGLAVVEAFEDLGAIALHSGGGCFAGKGVRCRGGLTHRPSHRLGPGAPPQTRCGRSGLARIVAAVRDRGFPEGQRHVFQIADESGQFRRIPLHRVREVLKDGQLIWRRPPSEERRRSRIGPTPPGSRNGNSWPAAQGRKGQTPKPRRSESPGTS